jgi:hypothetical protein
MESMMPDIAPADTPRTAVMLAIALRPARGPISSLNPPSHTHFDPDVPALT